MIGASLSTATIDLSHPIDLSHISHPGREEYLLEVDLRQVEEWPTFREYKRLPGTQYAISEIHLNAHTGTHVETPLHAVAGGTDVADFPTAGLVGEGVVIDISRWRENNAKITLPDLKAACGDRIRPGDMAFFYTGNDEFYYTPQRHQRPWFTTECITWLVREARIRVMGVDTSGHEIRNEDGSKHLGQPNHEALLGAGVPLIEYLANLDLLLDRRFATFVLPARIAGAEAFPVRVVAFELAGEPA